MTETTGALAVETFKREYLYIRRNARQVRPGKRLIAIIARSGNLDYLPILEDSTQNSPSQHIKEYSAALIKTLKKKAKRR